MFAGCSRPSEPKVGIYRATLTLPGGDLPFQLEIAKETDATVMYLVNGEERTRVSDVSMDSSPPSSLG
jgi:hypothetical protein